MNYVKLSVLFVIVLNSNFVCATGSSKAKPFTLGNMLSKMITLWCVTSHIELPSNQAGEVLLEHPNATPNECLTASGNDIEESIEENNARIHQALFGLPHKGIEKPLTHANGVAATTKHSKFSKKKQAKAASR